MVKEEITVKGNRLVERLKEIIEEGNTRHVIIKKDGNTLLEFPLSVGVGGTAAAVLLSPTIAALGAVGALVSDVKVVVERVRPADDLPAASDADEEE